MEKISLVTGGTSGLGKALVDNLVGKGLCVAVIARNIYKLDELKKQYGTKVECFAGDICDETFCRGVFDTLAKKGYYVDYLYNNAGVGIFGDPKTMDLAKIQKVMNSNTIGLMCLTYEALRRMEEGGTVINIMSTAAIKTPASESLYSASKCAVRGFTESLKLSYKKTNIHIIGVYPGGMNTPFWAPDCGSNPDTSKFMNPEEVADIIIFNVLERKTSYIADIVIERK